MFNKKLFSFVYLTLLFSTVFGKIMTKDEVLKIRPEDYKGMDEKQCPDFYNGDYWYLDRCGFEFYCKDDKTCSSIVRNSSGNSTVELPDASGNMKVYIADVCDPKDSSSCGNIGKCSSNDDCLSNKCENNYCVKNDDSKIFKCQDTYHYHILTFSSSVDMMCGKPDGYSCKKDSDCASDVCEDNLCAFQGRDHNLYALSSFALYFGIFVVVLAIGIIACCCCCCCGSKSRSAKNAGMV